MSLLKERLTVVILSYNRVAELQRTLEHMTSLPEQPGIIVVDNASTDSTTSMVQNKFPQVRLLISLCNMGGAARNLGVEAATTRYVAFCDDDSWWTPDSLPAAVELLDSYPNVAALCARILLGPEQREDPICTLMNTSPLPKQDLPGPALLGFAACAVVFRRQAYRDAGGYEPRFFVGGEEALLTLDLVDAGWSIVYVRQLAVHHYPSPKRDRKDRHRIVARNAIWVAWLRFPVHTAWHETVRMLRYASEHGVLLSTLRSVLQETAWMIRGRKVVSPQVQAWFRLLN